MYKLQNVQPAPAVTKMGTYKSMFKFVELKTREKHAFYMYNIYATKYI